MTEWNCRFQDVHARTEHGLRVRRLRIRSGKKGTGRTLFECLYWEFSRGSFLSAKHRLITWARGNGFVVGPI